MNLHSNASGGSANVTANTVSGANFYISFTSNSKQIFNGTNISCITINSNRSNSNLDLYVNGKAGDINVNALGSTGGGGILTLENWSLSGFRNGTGTNVSINWNKASKVRVLNSSKIDASVFNISSGSIIETDRMFVLNASKSSYLAAPNITFGSTDHVSSGFSQ